MLNKNTIYNFTRSSLMPKETRRDKKVLKGKQCRERQPHPKPYNGSNPFVSRTFISYAPSSYNLTVYCETSITICTCAFIDYQNFSSFLQRTID